MSYLEELLPEFRKGAKIRHESWKKNEFIYIKNDKIYNQNDEILLYSVGRCSNLFCDNHWELYQEPIDYDYIIKNKCLCWFWDENKYTRKIATFLYKKPRPSNKCFIDIDGSNWENCRPVSRDEVTFYEDRKDD